ncbi:MAG TPA: DUF3987 domain-containing protein, partial [Pirellulales bacterium]
MRLILDPGQVTELRALDAKLKGGYRAGTVSGYFDDAEKLANAIASVTSAKGIYFIPNQVNPALLARAANRIRLIAKEPTTSDHDIIARRFLLVDVDPVRPADISASNDEHQSALALALTIRDHLGADGWPDPIYADSGNGVHLMYRIDLPTDDGGLVERCLAALHARFSTDGVKVDTRNHNPARIWKLYGTLAAKGDSTADRPHRLAKIVEAPANMVVVPTDLLDAMAAAAPATKPANNAAYKTNGHGEAFDVERWIAEHHVQVDGPEPWQGGRRWIFPVCPWIPDHTNRSAYILKFANGAWTAGCHHNGCQGRNHEHLRDVIEPGWRERKTQNLGAAGASTAKVSRPAAAIAGVEGAGTAAQPWGEIVSFDECELPEFPTDVLPAVLRDWIAAESHATQTPADLAGLLALAVCAACIARKAEVEPRPGWREPVNCFVAV